METKHTPGPWAWQRFGGNFILVAQHGIRDIIISANTKDPKMGWVECYPSMNDDGILRPINPNHPDAKLIAAAPEMLTMLIELVGKENKKYEDSLKSASIHNNTDGVGIHFDYMNATPLPEWVKRANDIIKKATE